MFQNAASKAFLYLDILDRQERRALPLSGNKKKLGTPVLRTIHLNVTKENKTKLKIIGVLNN